ncbi:MAG: 16S rRNA (uracil(1498)-N(3))-methyltransferase [Gammaproteobacteria bacterium]|nr:16S rRNA (uracil(1498)-N(3))-methyltransferase [Gammaproteobacteria bacterium]MBU0772514.1 16S rRNA (uracil(1498)-N(3))-methyltransferase [Gammaproteobacteria bacterium]MBU0855059.1 16S rRNA (uracil(1498)-N(3))-methyltransferase [Gammaproteobacteria bacterium]MBU1847248.1 16S rRNA (uracil(1498)-N(3))-methyltransferase [Gammaproteobacteria bacterium]
MIPRFFCSLPADTSGSMELPPAVAHHVERVLRLDDGDRLTLFDGRGGEINARLQRAGRSLRAVLGERSEPVRESPLQITLLQCLAASDKMDWIVQKAVELGVARVQPLASRRAVLKLSGDRAQRRMEHWQQIAVSACEQCGRNRVPEVLPIVSLPQALAAVEPAARRLVLHPDGGVPLREAGLQSAQPISLLIGPEGGFDPEELAAARHGGFTPVTLGPRVLRTETAGVAVMAALNVLLGDY